MNIRVIVFAVMASLVVAARVTHADGAKPLQRDLDALADEEQHFFDDVELSDDEFERALIANKSQEEEEVQDDAGWNRCECACGMAGKTHCGRRRGC
jgi:hypothetical protein